MEKANQITETISLKQQKSTADNMKEVFFLGIFSLSAIQLAAQKTLPT